MEPVGGVAGIAFDQMEQGVDPASHGGVDVLGDGVGGFPLAVFAEPESLEFGAQGAGQ